MLRSAQHDTSAKLRKSTSYRRGDPLRSPDLREATEGLPYTECGLAQASTSVKEGELLRSLSLLDIGVPAFYNAAYRPPDY